MSAKSYDCTVTSRMAQQVLQLWDLPDVLLFNILTYVAPPTHRAGSICQLARLCKAARNELILKDDRPVWEILLKHDYSSSLKAEDRSRRIPKRLRRSAIHRVQDAHRLMKDNTEIVFYYLSELSTAVTAEKLTKSRMCRLIHDFGPSLRLNHTVSSGGLYLVEICRARKVKEATILSCVQALVEVYGALVDISSNESRRSRQTALCVAAVRAMPNVVQYLLQKGASRDIRSSGRFRLHTQLRKSVGADDVTPLAFCYLMLNAEKEAGASHEALKDLGKCIALLEN